MNYFQLLNPLEMGPPITVTFKKHIYIINHMQSNLNPDIFEITYGYDSNYKITYNKPELTFFNNIENIKVVKTPSSKEWENFWKTLAEIEIWDWYPQYECESLGEMSWHIKLKIDDKNIDSEGINGFPLEKYSTTPYISLIFEKFLKALEELTGQSIETYEEPSEPEFYPEKLSVSLLNQMEFSFEECFYFVGNQVSYSNKNPEINNVIAKPTTKQWKTFWNRLDEINVWGWKEYYKPEELVEDGYSWNIEIEYKNKKIESDWTNYTDNNLEQLFEALNELMS